MSFYQILTVPRIQPRTPAPGSIVIGVVSRLSSLQALLSITVVDGVPLLPGEEFTGVIRTQDVRATEKDRVKIGESFRGGDVVRSQVVSCTYYDYEVFSPLFFNSSQSRYLWAIRVVIS